MNTDSYLKSLRNTNIDKAFFIEKLPSHINTIIDYGCADGSFLVFLRNIYGNKYNYVGIEPNGDYYHIAVKNKLDVFSNMSNFLDKYNKSDYRKFCINFSSSLHEIYDDESACNIITSIMDLYKFGAISIRDMNVKIYEELLKSHYNTDRDTFLINILNVFMRNIPNKLHEFVEITPINNLQHVVHLLLKYFYKGDDWIKELNENYLSTCEKFENTLDLHKELGYDLIWKLDYNLPYLINKWINECMIYDYDYDCPWFTTHSQYLFIKKGDCKE